MALMDTLQERLLRSIALYDELAAALPESALVRKLPGLPSNAIGDQLWCVIGARESYARAIAGGDWKGFACSLTSDGARRRDAVTAALAASAAAVMEAASAQDGRDDARNRFLLDLLEHEAAHHGQLIRYLYALGIPFPDGWRARYALEDGGAGRPRITATVGSILDAIGGTPLVELKRVVPPGHARVFVKLESHNPTGSMKDRMALAVVDGAAASGRLSPGGRVVEYTGGSTGTSLAFVCAARGYAITVVTSDAFSREKRDHMRALGADVIEIPSHGGGTTRELIRAMIARAEEISAQPGSFFADQFHNPDAGAGYAPLAEELWEQSGGRVDAFVQSVGTAQCILGVAGVLRARNPRVRIVAVEPEESRVLSGGAPGAHKIEGVGPGFVPPRWDPDPVDEVLAVSTADAQAMARRLAREEALFAGTSSGANVVAALQVAERIGTGGTVLTLLCDSGLKYLSTDLYSAVPG